MAITTEFSDKTLTINVTDNFDDSNAKDFIEAFQGNEGDPIPDKCVIKINNVKFLDESAYQALELLHEYHKKAELHLICTEQIKHNIVNVQKMNKWTQVTTTDKPEVDFFKILKPRQ